MTGVGVNGFYSNLFLCHSGLSVVSNMLAAGSLTLIRHPGCVCVCVCLYDSTDSTGLLMANSDDKAGIDKYR